MGRWTLVVIGYWLVVIGCCKSPEVVPVGPADADNNGWMGRWSLVVGPLSAQLILGSVQQHKLTHTHSYTYTQTQVHAFKHLCIQTLTATT